MCKKISILKFNKNILIKVKEIVSGDSQINRKKLFLIWEDKKSKLDHIIQSNKESDSIIANIQNENKKLNNKNLNFITNYKLVKVKTKK